MLGGIRKTGFVLAALSREQLDCVYVSQECDIDNKSSTRGIALFSKRLIFVS